MSSSWIISRNRQRKQRLVCLKPTLSTSNSGWPSVRARAPRRASTGSEESKFLIRRVNFPFYNVTVVSRSENCPVSRVRQKADSLHMNTRKATTIKLSFLQYNTYRKLQLWLFVESKGSLLNWCLNKMSRSDYTPLHSALLPAETTCGNNITISAGDNWFRF